jgi:acetyl esterase
VLDDVQAEPIEKLLVDERWITVPADVGEVRVRIVRPPDVRGTLPAILYMEAAGCATPILTTGSSASSPSVPKQPSCSSSTTARPRAHYPVAIEQGYATAQWIIRNGSDNGLDPDRMAVAGDSVGGGMTAALVLMAKERGDVRFVQQSMYYPVTDSAMDTASYEQFAEGY